MKALILVDLQNDFFPGGALGVKGAHEIVPVIQELLKLKWDMIVASKDWHPSDHGSFAATHGKQCGERVVLNGLDQLLWPIHCVQGSLGAEFAPGWDSSKVSRVFYKGTDRGIDSYSTFFDNGHKKSTGLGEFLKQHQVNDVYIAGLATDYCVKYTTLDALDLGFQAFIIPEACRSVDLQPGDGEKALEDMRSQGAKIASLQQVKKELR